MAAQIPSLQAATVNVLIVDDIKENLLALSALLRRDDVMIYTAQSGAQALDLLLESDFAVAIIDVQMPEMNGFQLAEFMRATERTKRIPIIFVTAGSQESGQIFRGYESGAVDFLYKPLDGHVVRSKVNVFIEMYQQRLALNKQIVALQQARAEQEKLLAELRSTQQQLEQAIRMRDDFMSIVSHELRTPLNTFRLEYYTRRYFLENEKLDEFTPEKIAQMLDTDERQLERLVRLINDILDVSRIRTGQLSVRPTQVDLVSLVEKVVGQFQPHFAAAGCSAQFRADMTQQAEIRGQWDEFRLEQVLMNLLLNAMRYGSGKAIEVSVSATPGGARIGVRDYGKGIGPDDQQRIFEQFERGTSERKGSGLGLGLYIADQIVKAHGGRIYVSSQPGDGALFSVVLPKDFSESKQRFQ